MRGSIVVLALAITPLVAPIAGGQRYMRSHVTRHDMPLGWRHDDHNSRRDDDRRDNRRNDNTCKDPKGHDNMFWDWWSSWFGDKKSSSRSNGKCDPPPPNQPPQNPPPPPDTTPTQPSSGHTIINGLVFADADQNGVQDAGEAGLSGWTVQLTGPMNLTAVTDGTGSYSFDGLTAGQYMVCVTPPAGWMQTPIADAPSCGTSLYGYSLPGLELSAGDVVYAGVDFGFRQN